MSRGRLTEEDRLRIEANIAKLKAAKKWKYKGPYSDATVNALCCDEVVDLVLAAELSPSQLRNLQVPASNALRLPKVRELIRHKAVAMGQVLTISPAAANAFRSDAVKGWLEADPPSITGSQVLEITDQASAFLSEGRLLEWLIRSSGVEVAGAMLRATEAQIRAFQNDGVRQLIERGKLKVSQILTYSDQVCMALCHYAVQAKLNALHSFKVQNVIDQVGADEDGFYSRSIGWAVALSSRYRYLGGSYLEAAMKDPNVDGLIRDGRLSIDDLLGASDFVCNALRTLAPDAFDNGYLTVSQALRISQPASEVLCDPGVRRLFLEGKRHSECRDFVGFALGLTAWGRQLLCNEGIQSLVVSGYMDVAAVPRLDGVTGAMLLNIGVQAMLARQKASASGPFLSSARKKLFKQLCGLPGNARRAVCDVTVQRMLEEKQITLEQLSSIKCAEGYKVLCNEGIQALMQKGLIALEQLGSVSEVACELLLNADVQALMEDGLITAIQVLNASRYAANAMLGTPFVLAHIKQQHEALKSSIKESVGAEARARLADGALTPGRNLEALEVQRAALGASIESVLVVTEVATQALAHYGVQQLIEDGRMTLFDTCQMTHPDDLKYRCAVGARYYFDVHSVSPVHVETLENAFVDDLVSKESLSASDVLEASDYACWSLCHFGIQQLIAKGELSAREVCRTINDNEAFWNLCDRGVEHYIALHELSAQASAALRNGRITLWIHDGSLALLAVCNISEPASQALCLPAVQSLIIAERLMIDQVLAMGEMANMVLQSEGVQWLMRCTTPLLTAEQLLAVEKEPIAWVLSHIVAGEVPETDQGEALIQQILQADEASQAVWNNRGVRDLVKSGALTVCQVCRVLSAGEVAANALCDEAVQALLYRRRVSVEQVFDTADTFFDGGVQALMREGLVTPEQVLVAHPVATKVLCNPGVQALIKSGRLGAAVSAIVDEGDGELLCNDNVQALIRASNLTQEQALTASPVARKVLCDKYVRRMIEAGKLSVETVLQVDKQAAWVLCNPGIQSRVLGESLLLEERVFQRVDATSKALHDPFVQALIDDEKLVIDQVMKITEFASQALCHSGVQAMIASEKITIDQVLNITEFANQALCHYGVQAFLENGELNVTEVLDVSDQARVHSWVMSGILRYIADNEVKPEVVAFLQDERVKELLSQGKLLANDVINLKPHVRQAVLECYEGLVKGELSWADLQDIPDPSQPAPPLAETEVTRFFTTFSTDRPPVGGAASQGGASRIERRR